MKRFCFTLSCLFVLSLSVFAQDAVRKDLGRTFRNFDLVNLDKARLREKARTAQTVEIQAYGRQFQFVLTVNDLRAAGYRAVETTESGDREIGSVGAAEEVFTYKGKLIGDEASEVRLSVTENELEGLIYTGEGRKFFIAEADKFSARADAGQAVVYTENDLLETVDLNGDGRAVPGEVSGRLGAALDWLSSLAADSALAAELKEIEVATGADYQWVQQAGGAAAANSEILSILNLVDGIYRRDLNLTVRVTFQHAWSTADPYASGSSSALLDSFLAYWNANFPRSQYPRDTAHLFTGKLSSQGVAFLGVICRSPSYAYGLTARSGSANHLIAAHEIGHNLGADHVDNSGICLNSMMNPSIGFGVTAFCETSKNTIASYVAANSSCLSGAGGTTPTPSPTPTLTPTPTPTPSCTYSISPANQSFGSFGGSGSVTVTTQSGCNWTASNSNQNFVSILSGSLGSGSGTVFYSVAQNTSSFSRSETLVVAGRAFTVQQDGAVVSPPPPTSPNGARFDYDGDGRADVSVFRPSNGTWYRLNSSTGQFVAAQFGQAGDIPVIGDFDGDARSDLTVFRPSNGAWYIMRSSTGSFYAVSFGQSGDIPAAADFDGDQRTDVSVFRPNGGYWYRLHSSNNAFASQQFGTFGDKPAAADFDGDGRADAAVFRPSNGNWYMQRSASGFAGVQFGIAGDAPTPSLTMP